jgi:hypothetical protein
MAAERYGLGQGGLASPVRRPTGGKSVSSGGFTYSLSAAAAYVLRSLMERSHLQTADEIADASDGSDRIDAGTARGGLDELGSHGLAAEGPDGRWSLTGAGREAQQRA